ncbi:MAG: hypothetical protein FD167_2316, partial [bacterium]
FKLPSEVHVYSEASRYVKEVSIVLITTLRTISKEYFMIFAEYVALSKKGIPESVWVKELSEKYQTDQISFLSVAHWMSWGSSEPSSGINAEICWINNRFFIDEKCFTKDPYIEKMRADYSNVKEHRENALSDLARSAAMGFYYLSKKENRIRLFQEIQANKALLFKDHTKYYIEKALKEYQERFPNEYKETNLPTIIPKDKILIAKENPTELFGVEDAPPAGLTKETFLEGLNTFIHTLKYIEACKKLHKGFFSYHVINGQKIIEPPVLNTMRAFASQYQSVIPDEDIEKADWAEELFQEIIKTTKQFAQKLNEKRKQDTLPTWEKNYDEAKELYRAVTINLENLSICALKVLGEKQLTKWIEFWKKEVDWYDTHNSDFYKSFLTFRESHHKLALDFYRYWLCHYPTFCPMVMARFYQRPEGDAHDLVREIIASISIPDGANKSYYSRKDWALSYQWVISTAWKRKDAELLANACERCALPMFRKGSKYYVPIIDSLRESPYSRTLETEEKFSVNDLWTSLRTNSPERITGIIKHSFLAAEFEEPSRAILLAAAQDKDSSVLQPFVTEIFALLESSQPQVVTVGGELIAGHPKLFTDYSEDALNKLKHGLNSASSNTAIVCAEALGSIGKHLPKTRLLVTQVLSDGLWGETATVLEQVMKSLKLLTPINFEQNIIERIEELAKNAPRRFEKLAKTLLK